MQGRFPWRVQQSPQIWPLEALDQWSWLWLLCTDTNSGLCPANRQADLFPEEMGLLSAWDISDPAQCHLGALSHDYGSYCPWTSSPHCKNGGGSGGGAHGFHLLFWQNPWGLLGFPVGLHWEYEGGRPLSTPASPTVMRLLKFCLQNNFEAKSNLKNRGKQCSHPLHCLGTLLVVSTNTFLPQYSQQGLHSFYSLT